MGCFSSKHEADFGEAYLADAAPDTNGRAAKKSVKKNVSYLEQDFGIRTSNPSITGQVRRCAHESITLGVHRSNNSMSGLPAKAMSKSFVGADLHSIVDDKGTLTPLVSRQLSMMSHYSMRSESGSVLITAEDTNEHGFKLIKLIGRGGFGNVYLADWEHQKVAIKVGGLAGGLLSRVPVSLLAEGDRGELTSLGAG